MQKDENQQTVKSGEYIPKEKAGEFKQSVDEPINKKINKLVSPYTFVLLILLDFVYLIFDPLGGIPILQFFFYFIAAVFGAILVFIVEFLTNQKSNLKEKIVVALFGGLITMLPLPIFGTLTGIAGLAMRHLPVSNLKR